MYATEKCCAVLQANWVIVLLTGDRLVWVLLPFKAKGFCTLRNAAVALGGVSLSLLALYAVMPLAYSLSRTENARGTFTLCYLSPGLKKALSWIDLFSFSLLPFLIIFACNSTSSLLCAATVRTRAVQHTRMYLRYCELAAVTIIYKLNQYRRIRANMNKCGYKKAHSDCSPAVSSAPAPAIVVTPQNPSADSRYSRASFQRAVSKSSSLSPVTAVACGVSESDAFVTLECTQCSSGCPGTAKAAARKSVSATRSLHIALGPTRSASVREQPAPGSGVGGRAQMNSSRERTLTLMLLTVSIFFIVTTLPITTLNLVYLVLSPNFEDPENTTIAGYYDLMQTIAQVLVLFMCRT